MKIKKLIFENVGPYKGHHEIDFESLVSPLFIITGPTGSGKSYIFDAICFALYGKTSGDNRKPDGFKSSYARVQDTAYVDLSFEYQNKEYFIHREPKQIKSSVKKDGTIKEAKEVAAKSVLKMPNGDVIEKNVDKEVESIIGLSYDEFKMTMMIAQGDFYSLINADTKDRQSILRKILKTEKLEAFTNRLGEEYKIKEDALKETSAVIKTKRNRFDFSGDLDALVKNDNVLLKNVLETVNDELKLDCEKVGKLEKEREEALKRSREALLNYNNAKNDNENYDKYHSEKEKNDQLNSQSKDYSEKEQKIELAKKAKLVLKQNEKVNEEKEKVEGLIKELEELNNNLKDSKKEKEVKAQELKKVETLEKENEKLNVEINDKESIINSLDDYNKTVSDLKASEEKLEEKKAKLLELEDKIKALSIYINMPSVDGDIARIEIELASLEEEISSFTKKKKLVDDYLKEINKQRKLVVELEEKQGKLNRASQEATCYELRYHKSLAGILAKDLAEGEKCPVCGATHHVELAKLDEDISKETLDSYKEKAQTAQKEFNDTSRLLDDCVLKISSYKDKISEFIKDEFDETNVSDLFSELESEKNKLKEEKTSSLQELREEQRHQEEAKESEKKLNKDKDVLLKEKSELDSQVASLKGVLKAKENLKGLDKESIKKEKEELERKLNTNKELIKKITDDYNEVSGKVKELQGSIKSKNEALESAKIDKEKSINDLNKIIEETGISSIEKANTHNINDSDLKVLEEDIDNYKNALNGSNVLINSYIESGYDKLEKKDLTVLEQKKDEEEDKYNNLDNELKEESSRYKNNKTIYDELIVDSENYDREVDECNQVKKLYDVAMGKISGKKINFEVYYQKQIFSEIIAVASQKFYQMSDNRFMLVEGKSQGGNAQIGLEIDVYDYYSGSKRAVSGLSGGESFQASMALALAFSEVIQTKAGGVELNSMFIDEGFGTLDSEKLEKTKETLLGLGEITSRTVGVISHIKDLEDSIRSKIIVKKGNNGSSIEVRND